MMKLPTVDDCEGCGVCCWHMGYPAYIQPDGDQRGEVHWYRLPKILKQELLVYVESYQSPPEGELDGPCFWLDPATRKCKHHQYRPNVCRDFRVGSQGCIEWREHYRDQIQIRE